MDGNSALRQSMVFELFPPDLHVYAASRTGEFDALSGNFVAGDAEEFVAASATYFHTAGTYLPEVRGKFSLQPGMKRIRGWGSKDFRFFRSWQYREAVLQGEVSEQDGLSFSGRTPGVATFERSRSCDSIRRFIAAILSPVCSTVADVDMDAGGAGVGIAARQVKSTDGGLRRVFSKASLVIFTDAPQPVHVNLTPFPAILSSGTRKSLLQLPHLISILRGLLW
jgi:hypothetical protein